MCRFQNLQDFKSSKFLRALSPQSKDGSLSQEPSGRSLVNQDQPQSVTRVVLQTSDLVRDIKLLEDTGKFFKQTRS